jgi:hypothetical protein
MQSFSKFLLDAATAAHSVAVWRELGLRIDLTMSEQMDALDVSPRSRCSFILLILYILLSAHHR